MRISPLKYIRTFWKLVQQRVDYKNIPIIIISFNQLYYLRELVTFLLKHNYRNIIIIDNHSSYPPLLEYFNSIESKVKIIRLNKNYGHTVFWDNESLFKKYSSGYYVITDPDIVPVSDCPQDFLKTFYCLLKENKNITKVGFSLKIDDIPETNKNKPFIVQWEKQFWENKEKNYYLAGIDTTFALYRPNYRKKEGFCDAIRVDYPYQAIHGGWYIDNDNLSEEQKFYMKHTSASSSWRVDDDGNLLNEEYKNYFNK